MTDEARRLHYSPAHWAKMRDQQRIYINKIRAEFNAINFCTVGEARHYRILSVLRSATARYKEIEFNYFLMSGHLCYSHIGQKSIIINGVNYGLMLEGLRRHMRKEIDEKAETMFKRIELHHSCRMFGDILIHISNAMKRSQTFQVQTVGRLKRGTPVLKASEIPIGNYEVVLRDYKRKK